MEPGLEAPWRTLASAPVCMGTFPSWATPRWGPLWALLCSSVNGGSGMEEVGVVVAARTEGQKCFRVSGPLPIPPAPLPSVTSAILATCFLFSHSACTGVGWGAQRAVCGAPWGTEGTLLPITIFPSPQSVVASAVAPWATLPHSPSLTCRKGRDSKSKFCLFSSSMCVLGK